ncbi:hypothetical protein [Sphingomonas sp.]|uniref:hypothetical protein n=1 Tax=Sphingomonas sp. TaxID=28214 RepID=UPI0035C7B593
MRTFVLLLGTGLALAGCTTRGELRADRRDVRIQSAQCQNAKAYRGKRAQRVQCAQARDARRELKQDLRNPD